MKVLHNDRLNLFSISFNWQPTTPIPIRLIFYYNWHIFCYLLVGYIDIKLVCHILLTLAIQELKIGWPFLMSFSSLHSMAYDKYILTVSLLPYALLLDKRIRFFFLKKKLLNSPK